MQAVRAPAVAGSFYPADPSQLRETVARLLAGAAYGAPPKALIAPHAGHAHSAGRHSGRRDLAAAGPARPRRRAFAGGGGALPPGGVALFHAGPVGGRGRDP